MDKTYPSVPTLPDNPGNCPDTCRSLNIAASARAASGAAVGSGLAVADTKTAVLRNKIEKRILVWSSFGNEETSKKTKWKDLFLEVCDKWESDGNPKSWIQKFGAHASFVQNMAAISRCRYTKTHHLTPNRTHEEQVRARVC